MARHGVVIRWQRNGAVFTDRRYSRRHAWHFDGGTEVPATSSPAVVPVPLSDPVAVDPEEAFVAALSSCHMLWFLDLAARAGWTVDAYEDHAGGTLAPRADGRLWLSHVALDPAVRFGGARAPSDGEVRALHDRAHEECFLANAVKCRISIGGTWTHAAPEAAPST